MPDSILMMNVCCRFCLIAWANLSGQAWKLLVYRVLLKGGYYAQYTDVHMFELTDCDYSVTP